MGSNHLPLNPVQVIDLAVQSGAALTDQKVTFDLSSDSLFVFAESVAQKQDQIFPDPIGCHVDNFISVGKYHTPEENYARFVLMLMRLPAGMQMAFAEHTRQYKLFCTVDGKRYRVTMASRLGDIGINENPYADSGYSRRVLIKSCSNWSMTYEL